MKKTLFLFFFLGQGGAERFLLNVLPHLDLKKVLVVSITGVDDLRLEYEKRGIRVVFLNSDKKFNISSILKFRRIIKEFKPEILFSLLIHADLFGRVFGRLFGIKKIYCSIRNDYSLFDDMKFLGKYAWRLDRYSRFLVTKYFPNSQGLFSYMKKLGVHKYEILPNGVDIEAFRDRALENDVRSELELDKKSFVLCCNARLEKQKNHFTLLRAMKDNDFELVLVNDGSFKGEIERKIKSLNLVNRVHVLGKRNDVPSILRASDVFVLPSFTEGMSNALLEAMALGLPCIVSDIEQNRVLITHNYNGFVFSTQEELSKYLLMLREDKSLRETFSKRSRELIEKEYDIRVIAKKLRRILK